MESNFDIVIDNTHFNPTHEQRYRNLAKAKGYEFEVKEFNIDLLTCIERNDARPENTRVPTKAIVKMYRKYIYHEPSAHIEATGKIVICDIDGTVAFKCDRDIYDYSKVAGDYANKKLFAILGLLHMVGMKIVFLSGRDEDCKEETSRWLEQYFKGDFMLAMRKSGDKRCDTIVKKEIFEAFMKPEEVFCVFDDRPKVRTMWLQQGLCVFGCNQEPYNLPF
jgi:hypothetical protein